MPIKISFLKIFNYHVVICTTKTPYKQLQLLQFGNQNPVSYYI